MAIKGGKISIRPARQGVVEELARLAGMPENETIIRIAENVTGECRRLGIRRRGSLQIQDIGVKTAVESK